MNAGDLQDRQRRDTLPKGVGIVTGHLMDGVGTSHSARSTAQTHSEARKRKSKEASIGWARSAQLRI